MALYLRQQQSRTALQERLATELREKQRPDQPLEYEKPTSSVEEGSHISTNLGPILVMIGAVIVLGVAYLLLSR